MTTSLVLACVWLVVTNVIGMLPSKDLHWRNAYVLIAIGVPLLGWVWWQNGWLIALAVLLAAMSVLRWPVIYLVRWVKRLLG